MEDSQNPTRAGFVAFALCVAIAVALTLSSNPRTAYADPTDGQATGPRLVIVFLKSNTLLSNLSPEAKAALKPTQGAAQARAAAQRSPYHFSDAEKVAASIADNSRNSALPAIRRAARTDVNISTDVQASIRHLGGRVVSASPIPNQVTAWVEPSTIAALRSDPDVASIAPTSPSTWMNAPVDGSPVWHTNGFTGQGTSLDGDGSPDFVSFDLGTRTTHDAFRTRMPGDCATCLGSGPTRIISPTVRQDFSGSKHGNTVTAMIGATAFKPGMNPSASVGMAYGIDKVYDNYEAYNPYLWDLGINTPRPIGYPTSDPANDPGLGGNTDLPEVINYSAGIYEDTTDTNAGWVYFDSLESIFGILNTVSAGNCGIQTGAYTNCNTGPHRVSTPGNNYNVLTVGGFQSSTVYPDTSGYAPWPNTSPGPTWGGRKKPDLVATVFGTSGTPSAIDDTTWTSGGDGTSYAAPQAAAGALLLASTGVYDPKAQRAILINSTTPVQGQTYWTPRTGWGALNLETAFPQRGFYALGSVGPNGNNDTRFFQINGVASGDRATLVWDRRTTPIDNFNPTYYNLTNLDLTQFNPGTLAVTSTGGSDAADTVDTDQTVTAANPMPGNGTDGGDNVEQIRSTSTGAQILKVKAMSSIDGASSEPFAIAAAHAPTALQTPIPTVTLSATPNVQGLSQNVTVSASVHNPSADLALSSSSVLLQLPSGTTLTGGTNPAPTGTIAANGTTVVNWTVQANTSGTKNFTASASGQTYGETFSGSDSEPFDADGVPPVISITPPPTYSTTTSPGFTWSAVDASAAVDTYDVESALDSGPWTPVLTATTQTTTNVAASEGQTLHLRVRARDTFGNESGWSEVPTVIDAEGPTIAFGAATKPSMNSVSVPVSFANVGSPITSSLYSFSAPSAPATSTIPGSTLTYVNNTRFIQTATLLVSVTDAAGHTATKVQTFTVPPTTIAANLQLAKTKVKSRKATIKGTLNSAASGKVTITIRRKGKTGTKKVVKSTSVSRGKFTKTVKLKKGKYTVTASFPGSTGVSSGSQKRSFAVK